MVIQRIIEILRSIPTIALWMGLAATLPADWSVVQEHPYTDALLSAVPTPDPRLRSDRIILKSEVADPANTPSGCHFHPRCKYAQAVCREKSPAQEEIGPNHFVSCHRATELSLRGVDRSSA